jgi:hypothetical protein
VPLPVIRFVVLLDPDIDRVRVLAVNAFSPEAELPLMERDMVDGFLLKV